MTAPETRWTAETEEVLAKACVMTDIATTVEDLTPAALTPESLARVHALWSWTYRMDVCQLQAAMAKLTVRELKDVRLATDMLDSYVTTELLRRLVPGPTVGQVAESILTPDAVSGGVA